MNARCARFRTEIEEAAGAAVPLALLARDAHALECRECRAELVRAGALERLLESVPRPGAPPGLAQRVLAGLADARRGRGEDRGDPLPAAPLERELEELLDVLPEPSAPAGLARRVLRSLAHERARPRRRVRWPWLVAAGMLAALALWSWRQRRTAPQPELVLEPARELEADEDLLVYAVERWELLHDEDLDVWLASLDPILVEDELLTAVADGFGDGEGWLPNAPEGVVDGAGGAGEPGRKGD